METFRFKLFLIFLLLMLSVASLYAQNDDLRRYYPLEDGYKWAYEIITEEESMTKEVEIAGKEYAGNIETVRMMYEGEGYDCVAADTEGVKVYKEVDGDGSYKIYGHPSIILPFNIEKVKSFKNEASYSGYDDKGKLKYKATSSEEIWFKAKEDVMVPAGSFKNCLKLFTVLKWREGDGSFGEGKIEAWLAKDVGLVKMIKTGTEYTIDNDDVNVNVDIEGRRLKKAVLGNKIYGEPH